MAQNKTMSKEQLEIWLARQLERVVQELTGQELGIQEGKVMTEKAPPYRRLDCNGRALAYLRVRAKKKAVRIDVTGLWKTPRRSKLQVPNAGGAATLLIRTPAETRLAIKFLRRCVELTLPSQPRVPVLQNELTK